MRWTDIYAINKKSLEKSEGLKDYKSQRITLFYNCDIVLVCGPLNTLQIAPLKVFDATDPPAWHSNCYINMKFHSDMNGPQKKKALPICIHK